MFESADEGPGQQVDGDPGLAAAGPLLDRLGVDVRQQLRAFGAVAELVGQPQDELAIARPWASRSWVVR